MSRSAENPVMQGNDPDWVRVGRSQPRSRLKALFGRVFTRRASPLSILVTAALFTMWCGAVEFGLPLDDLLRGARNWATPRKADQQTVVVTIDDKTIQGVGLEYSEQNDARAIEHLMAAGARRVYYDRVFQDVADPAGAAELIKVLDRYPGRVFFGSMRSRDVLKETSISVVPDARYRGHVGLVSLDGKLTPFGLSSRIYLADTSPWGAIPSLSASVAGVQGTPGERYRPDLRILASSVPRISYLDVIRGQFAAGTIAGRDVVVGPDTTRIIDHHHVIGQGFIPGVYIHAMGAQTLREGTPTAPSWLYPYLVAMALAICTLRTRNRKIANRLHVSALALAVVVPFITDRLFMTIDYVPAIMLYVLVASRSHYLKAIDSAEQYNADSGLPNLTAFRNERSSSKGAIAALTIKNYETILAAFPDIDVSRLLAAICRPIIVSESGARIYHEGNTLYWRLPELGDLQLADHLHGLTKLIETIRLAGATIDVDFAIGIDTAVSEPTARRINSAKIAAGEAASKGLVQSFYLANSPSQAQWRLSLMSELDEAVTQGAISVVYQPQVDFRSGTIRSAEALARWIHPLRGPIPPTDFIAQAEATNRIERLTYYVLDRALGDAADVIRTAPDFEVSVNISTKLLASPDMPGRIRHALRKAQVDPRNLKLEITETAALLDDEMVFRNLSTLAELGAKLSIDDYGTGNATLEYLRTIPFDEIKIDRQFVTDITTSNRDQLLVQSTITLAHALGRLVVAEGVESESTLNLLQKLGCDRAQGFYVARPAQVEVLKGMVNQPFTDALSLRRSRLAFG